MKVAPLRLPPTPPISASPSTSLPPKSSPSVSLPPPSPIHFPTTTTTFSTPTISAAFFQEKVLYLESWAWTSSPSRQPTPPPSASSDPSPSPPPTSAASSPCAPSSSPPPSPPPPSSPPSPSSSARPASTNAFFSAPSSPAPASSPPTSTAASAPPSSSSGPSASPTSPRYSNLLSCSVDEKFLPCIDYFERIGFHRRDAVSMFRRFPHLFCYSIGDTFEPKFDYFVVEMGMDLRELKEFPQYFSFSLDNRIKPRHRMCVDKGVVFPLPLMLKTMEAKFRERLEVCWSSSPPCRSSPLWGAISESD